MSEEGSAVRVEKKERGECGGREGAGDAPRRRGSEVRRADPHCLSRCCLHSNDGLYRSTTMVWPSSYRRWNTDASVGMSGVGGKRLWSVASGRRGEKQLSRRRERRRRRACKWERSARERRRPQRVSSSSDCVMGPAAKHCSDSSSPG